MPIVALTNVGVRSAVCRISSELIFYLDIAVCFSSGGVAASAVFDLKCRVRVPIISAEATHTVIRTTLMGGPGVLCLSVRS